MSQPEATLGLRERKNRRTRLAIVQATVELTLEGGYASATIQRIAERADIAPRTVSTWFPHKDDILFEGGEELIELGVAHFQRTEGDVVDRLLAWFADAAQRTESSRDPEIERLRNQAIHHDPELRGRYRRYFERIQVAVAEAVARDTGLAVDDLGPQLMAGAAMTFLEQLAAAANADPTQFDDDQDTAFAKLGPGIDFLRAGLASVQASAKA